MTRKPMFAGSFYESNFDLLDKQIAGLFEHKRGPGALPVHRRSGTIKAIIAPHAGYQYSGPCAAWSYKILGEAELADVYIIIGPNHKGSGSCFSGENWETPSGIVRIDQSLLRSLQEKTGIPINEEAHAQEHSIEVQLPLLQFVNKNDVHKLKIIPLLLDYDVDLKKLALDLKEILMDSGKKVSFIISTDFTHYGRNYGYIPFSLDVKKNIYAMDNEAIEFIKEKNPEGLLSFAHEKMSTICGVLPIALLLYTIQPKEIRLEQYYTSADILEKEHKNSVSYASIIFS